MPEKRKWTPSQDALDAIGRVHTILEQLAPRDRGYVISRIAACHIKIPSTGSPASTLSKTKAGASKASPTAYNAEWKGTQEYIAWKALPKLTAASTQEDRAAYALAQSAAMQKKKELTEGNAEHSANVAVASAGRDKHAAKLAKLAQSRAGAAQAASAAAPVVVDNVDGRLSRAASSAAAGGPAPTLEEPRGRSGARQKGQSGRPAQ